LISLNASSGATGRVDGPPITASFGLAPDGVYPASMSPSTRCALTAPFRPCPYRCRQWAVCFCGTFRRVAPPGR